MKAASYYYRKARDAAELGHWEAADEMRRLASKAAGAHKRRQKQARNRRAS